MTRWTPTHSLVIGGQTLSDYLLSAELENCVTLKVPSCHFVLDNIGGKWTTSPSIEWHDLIVLTLDGTVVFKGYVDEPLRSITKIGREGGDILDITGRGYGAPLQDIVSNLHLISTRPYNAVNEILAEYNRRKLVSSDPVIDMGANEAPSTGNYYTFQWKRKNLWEMLMDVSTLLGSSNAQADFYDLWVDIQPKLFFKKIGTWDSGVTITNADEIKRRVRHYDSLPVKNDIWVIGDNVGSIPLQLQPNYNGYGQPITDPWTEGNAADYISSGFDSKTDDSVVFKVGSKSIKMEINDIRPGPTAYWMILFPFPYYGDQSKWPGNPPNDVLNAYNECPMRIPLSSPSTYSTAMRETMGEIVGIAYWLRSIVSPGTTELAKFDHWIRVIDTAGLRADSNHITVNGTTPELNQWQPVSFPFGPSANYTSLDLAAGVNWWRIQKILFMCTFQSHDGLLPPVKSTINFDGFQFVKPLVVHAQDAPLRSLRTEVIQKTAFTDYWTTKLFAEGELENYRKAQTYWELEGIGRSDIQAGQRFRIDSLDLLMREFRYSYSKGDGWVIKGMAWEAN